MKRVQWLAALILGTAFCAALCAGGNGEKKNPVDFLGQTPPGNTAVIFAPDALCAPEEFVQDIAFSPKGDQICFVKTKNPNNEWNGFTLMFMNKDTQGKWSIPVPAPFNEEVGGAFRPCYSPDGRYVYFIGEPWPRNIFRVERVGAGWGKPECQGSPLNSDKTEHSISFGGSDYVYFCSHRDGGSGVCDIFSAKITPDGNFVEARNISSLNTPTSDCGPVPSPDGRYLIFHSTRDGNPDIYVSRKTETGIWSSPVRLGSQINTPGVEVIPTFSPDGKFIFFTRRAGFVTDVPSRIYWVSSDILNDAFKS